MKNLERLHRDYNILDSTFMFQLQLRDNTIYWIREKDRNQKRSDSAPTSTDSRWVMLTKLFNSSEFQFAHSSVGDGKAQFLGLM